MYLSFVQGTMPKLNSGFNLVKFIIKERNMEIALIAISSTVMTVLMIYGGDIIEYFKNKQKIKLEIKKIELEIAKCDSKQTEQQHSTEIKVSQQVQDRRFKWIKLSVTILVAIAGTIAIPLIIHYT